MSQEIILVTLIDGCDLNLMYTKTFYDVNKAQDYFVELINNNYPEYAKDYTKEDFDSFLDNGYCEINSHVCAYINEVPLLW